MKSIEKYVSQYVANQFPSFYREEGETFVAFVKAYYEWLESSLISTVYLGTSPGTYEIGDTVVQFSTISGNTDVTSVATVTEVGSGFIKVMGSGVSLTVGSVYKLDAIDSSPSGKVTSTVGSSVVTGTGTSFLSEVEPGDFIVSDGEAYEVEYVASDDVAKIPFKSGAAFAESSYVVYKVSQKSSVTKIESSPNVIRAGRELPSYADVDSTLDVFIDHFIKKYLNGIPKETLGDKRTLIKNIVRFYRAKGTDDAFKFLFRLLYNESVEIYVPGRDILRASDSEWVLPLYIEVSDSPYVKSLVGKEIYNSSKTATALVENYTRKVIKNKPINVLSVTQVQGDFKYGEYVLCDGVTTDVLLSPKVIGSLSSLTIDDGGYGFAVGDVVNVEGSGLGAKARVTSIENLTGKVRFAIRDGGSGYSVDESVVTVSPVYNMTCNGDVSSVVVGETVYQASGSNTFVGTVLSTSASANTLVVKRTSGTPNNSLSLVTVTTALTLDLSSFFGGGSGATFAVGGIKDTEVIEYSEETLTPFLTDNIDDGSFQVTMTAVNAGTFEVGEVVTGDVLTKTLLIGYGVSSATFDVGEQVTTGVSTAIVDRVDGDTLVIKGFGPTTYFFEGDTLTGVDSGAVATIIKSYNNVRVSAEATVLTVAGDVITTDVPFCYTTLEGYYIPSVTISSGGTGYAVGDVVEFIGGSYVDTPATAYVDAVSGVGAITSVKLVSQGRYSTSTLPDVGVQSTAGTAASLSISFSRVAGCYVTDMYLTGANSAAIGYVTGVERLYDWVDFGGALDNLDSKINETLDIKSRVVGTIDYLKQVSPGSGYNVNPHVEVVENDIANLYLYDAARDSYKGKNAQIDAIAGGLTGIIKSVEVIDSGYGYSPQDRVTLTSETNEASGSATSVIFQRGRSPGFWRDDTSFLSSNKYIIDSYYYQEYSYDLRSKVMIDRYKEILLKLAHPVGSIPFGSFLYRDFSVDGENSVAASYVTQAEDA